MTKIDDEIAHIDQEIKILKKNRALMPLCGRAFHSKYQNRMRICARAKGHRGKHMALGEYPSSNE